MKSLTSKQKKFCEEYLIDLNATQAAIRAGYSSNRASEIGYQLLHKTTVQGVIQKLQKLLSEKTDVSAQKVINEFAKIAFTNPKELFGEDGSPLSISELPDNVAAVVSEIKTRQLQSKDSPVIIETTYRLHSKVAALENLSKHLGLFEKDNIQKGNEMKTVVILPSNNRNETN